jgi:hypothetical protein
MLNQLTDIGFKSVGEWFLIDSEIELKIHEEGQSKNVLYCFVVNGLPKYIGETVQNLSKRMYGYRKPSASQSTNIRKNANINKALNACRAVHLYVLPDHGLLHFGRFHLNLAAGLEDSIVSTLSPEWNAVGKSKL